ncbi:MAG TPA: sulfotransferase, partial [Planctomycetota bacterium]|nr:sulfotransferase [Planctomycetota bacterium]
LLRDADGPARLTTVGRIAACRQFVTLLRNRLLVRLCLRDHPEILQVPLDRPLFVVGQARTGTTLLYNLLAQDPAARAPRLWELARPVPPPDPEGTRKDPRVGELERDLASLLSVIPAVMTAHALDPRGPEECYHLLETAAFSATFLLYFEIPTYWSRLMLSSPQEAREAYAEFRRQIQILQLHAGGRRWVSKAPSHLFFLDALLEEVPEARIVHTHRDPLESIPSLCSLISIVRSFSSDRVDPAAIGAQTMEWYLEAGRRSESARTRAGDRIIDVVYPRLLADPVGTVKAVYDRLGYPFTAAFEGRMRSWLAENPQHKHGVHRYSLEQFGLDPARVEAATREYRATRLPRS